MNIPPRIATIEDPAGKSYFNEKDNPKKLAITLRSAAMINTARSFLVNIMAQTAGTIR